MAKAKLIQPRRQVVKKKIATTGQSKPMTNRLAMDQMRQMEAGMICTGKSVTKTKATTTKGS